MLLVLHIISALAGLLLGTFGVILPSGRKMMATVALLLTTLFSGILLVAQTHVAILPACSSGLAYAAVLMILLLGARVRLKSETIS